MSLTNTQTKQNASNISQIKRQLINVIENIKVLENFEKDDNKQISENSIEDIKGNVNELLYQLENKQLENLKKYVKKRQRKRKSKKIKRQQNCNKNREDVLPPVKETSVSEISQTSVATNKTPVALADQNTKMQHNLEKQKNAERLLQTFDLLKMLHFARGQDSVETQLFNTNFNSLRTTWNKILLNNTTQRDQECKIEDQWNITLFGDKETFYNPKQKLNDFLRIRRTWDSYLTHSVKYGSAIPTGWVLPKDTPSEDWQHYRSQ